MDLVCERLKYMTRAQNADAEQLLCSAYASASQMLRDRGCDYVFGVEAGGDVEEWISTAMADNVPVLIGGPLPSTRVFFCAEERVAIRMVRDVMMTAGGDEDGEEDDDAPALADRTIFVSLCGATSFAKREASSAWGTAVQFFRYMDLIVNVTRHALVPRHEKIGEDEDLDLRPADVAHYPRLLTSDPISMYYDFKEGNVVRVTRCAGSSEPFRYYRIVVTG